MSAESLPYALLILVVELAVGSLWVVWAADWRGKSTPSFIKFCAVSLVALAAIAVTVAAAVDIEAEVDGYPLDPSFAGEMRIALVVMLALSVAYAVLTSLAPDVGARHASSPDPASSAAPTSPSPSTPPATSVPRPIAGIPHGAAALVAGGAASLGGLAAIGFLAAVVAPPTWGFVLTFASLVVAALVVGAVSAGMTLGHWYLVTPRLPEQPLREMTFFLLVAMAVQALLLLPALALPHDDVSSSVDTPILENPFFWLRVGVGLAFPMALAWMAWDSSGVRAMQSATGLLYIAMAAVLAGEVVGKGLLFTSGVPN